MEQRLPGLRPPEPRAARHAAAIEAVLLAATRPLGAPALAAALGRVEGREVEVAEVEQAVERLRGVYAARGAGLAIETWAEGYALATRPDLSAYVEAALAREKPVRLSAALLETLAVVAYRQPVTRPEIDHLRGVDSTYTVGRLAELGLVAAPARGEGVGKPLLYTTTPLFLETFGLAGLDALPTLREIDDLLGDPAYSREKARLLLFDASDAPPAHEAPPSSEK